MPWKLGPVLSCPSIAPVRVARNWPIAFHPPGSVGRAVERCAEPPPDHIRGTSEPGSPPSDRSRMPGCSSHTRHSSADDHPSRPPTRMVEGAGSPRLRHSSQFAIFLWVYRASLQREKASKVLEDRAASSGRYESGEGLSAHDGGRGVDD